MLNRRNTESWTVDSNHRSDERIDCGQLPVRKSLIYVVPAWPPVGHANGIISYTSRLVLGLTSAGRSAHLLTWHLREEDGCDAVHSISRFLTPRSRILLKAANRLRLQALADRTRGAVLARTAHQLDRQIGIQILQMEEAFGLPKIVARSISMPLVVRLHGPWFLNGAANACTVNREYERRIEMEGVGIEAAHGITAPSAAVLSATRSHYGLALENAAVIPNSIPPEDPANLWSYNAAEPETILFIGRFDRHKGGDVVLLAFEQILKERPFAQLIFVGPDSGFSDANGRDIGIQEFISERLSSFARSRTAFLGQQNPAMLDLLRRRAAVTVVASRYETFGNTVLEAMRLGCPLVATRTGGIPEIVEHERSGLLCKPGDVDDLAAKLLRLLHHPKFAAELGRNALRISLARYAPLAVAKQTLEFYEEVGSRWRASVPVRLKDRARGLAGNGEVP